MGVTDLGFWPGFWTPIFSPWCLVQDLRGRCLWLTRFAGAAAHWGWGDVFPSGDMTATRHYTSPLHLCGRLPWTHSTRLRRKPVLLGPSLRATESALPNLPLPLEDNIDPKTGRRGAPTRHSGQGVILREGDCRCRVPPNTAPAPGPCSLFPAP